jgi:hypothetical protein
MSGCSLATVAVLQLIILPRVPWDEEEVYLKRGLDLPGRRRALKPLSEKLTTLEEPFQAGERTRLGIRILTHSHHVLADLSVAGKLVAEVAAACLVTDVVVVTG